MDEIETDPGKWHVKFSKDFNTQGNTIIPYEPALDHGKHLTLGDGGSAIITLEWPMEINENWYPRACCRDDYYPYWHLFQALKEARKHPP